MRGRGEVRTKVKFGIGNKTKTGDRKVRNGPGIIGTWDWKTRLDKRKNGNKNRGNFSRAEGRLCSNFFTITLL